MNGRVWREGLRSFAVGLCDLVFPPTCAFCEVPLSSDSESRGRWCSACAATILEPPTVRCRKCAARVAVTMRDDADCPWCRDHALRFDRTVTLGTYRDELRDAVLKQKRIHSDAPTRALGEMLWAREGGALAKEQIDAVVPVPMHWRRRLRRGWNGPELTAALLAHRLGVGDYPRLLRRSKATKPQAGLSPTQRRENVRRAFTLRWGYRVAGAVVLLVDDVLTTGATCSEAAAALKRAGAARVVVAVFGRAQGET